MASTTSGSVGASYAPGWYAIKLGNGTIGLVLHKAAGAFTIKGSNSPLQTATLITANTNTNPQDILDSQVGTLDKILVKMGATAAQLQTLVAQSSQGIGEDPTLATFLIPATNAATSSSAIDTNGNPLSTSLKGDAIPSNIIPSPSVPSSWATGLSDVLDFVGSERGWIRILEYIGGAALIFIAIKSAADGH